MKNLIRILKKIFKRESVYYPFLTSYQRAMSLQFESDNKPKTEMTK